MSGPVLHCTPHNNLFLERQLGGLTGLIAPVLYHGLLYFLGVGSGPGTDLLRNIHALLALLELGDQLGDMFTLLLGLNHTFLLRLLADNRLYLIVTHLWSLSEGTALGSTELSGLLVTASHGGVFRHSLLRQRTLLLRPGLTVGLRLVAHRLVLALLLLHRLAGHHVVLNLVWDLLGPTFRLILSPADCLALDVAVLHQGLPADLSGHVVGNVHHLDVTNLTEHFITLHLLDWSVGGGVALVTSLVIAVVTGLMVLPYCLLHHHHLLDTFLVCWRLLWDPSVLPAQQRVDQPRGNIVIVTLVMFVMIAVISVVMIVMMIGLVGVEGKAVDEGLLQPGLESLAVSRGQSK